MKLVLDYSIGFATVGGVVGAPEPEGVYSFLQANHGRGAVWDRTPSESCRHDVTRHDGFKGGGVVVDWEFGTPSLPAWRALLSRYALYSEVIAHGIDTGTSRVSVSKFASVYGPLCDVLRENAASFSLDLYRVPGESEGAWTDRVVWRQSLLAWVEQRTGIPSYQFVTPHDYAKPDVHGVGAVVSGSMLERIAEMIEPSMGVAIHANASRPGALASLDAGVSLLASKVRTRLGLVNRPASL